MTKRQLELLRFIGAFIAEHGFSPTYDEMAAALGLKSKGNIARLIAGLKREGKIACDYYQMRSVRVLPPVGQTEVIAAALALLASIRTESPSEGYAVVGSAALGDLDIAVAEALAGVAPHGE